MTDLTVNIQDGKLNIRVAAWIEDQDHILVATFPDGSKSLPGGRLKFAENTLVGIQREILEETGLIFKSARLLAIVENFFFDKTQFHEFLYIYQGQIDKDYTFQFETSVQEKISWIPKSSITELKPEILQQLALSLNQGNIQHFVNVDSY